MLEGMKIASLPLGIACLALAAAGCGSSTNNGGSSDTSSQNATPSANGDGTAVEMKNIQFSPREQAVKVGEKVTWVNQDDVDHNVTTTGGPAKFNSNNFGKGGTYTYTPGKAGKIQYTCTLHPGMDGVLNVTQ
jgi:plastocyanin